MQIIQDEFNREMEAYLSSKPRQEETRPQKRRLDVPRSEGQPGHGEKVTEDDVEFDSIKEPWYHRVVDLFIGRPKRMKVEEGDEPGIEVPPKEVSAESIEQAEGDVVMETRKGIFSKLFSLFGGEGEEEAEYREEEAKPADEQPKEHLDPEIKKLMKIQHRWMERLPPEVIAEFKGTPEYAEYKMLLEKYHLIKKVEP
jgi:hypothetical protein